MMKRTSFKVVNFVLIVCFTISMFSGVNPLVPTIQNNKVFAEIPPPPGDDTPADVRGIINPIVGDDYFQVDLTNPNIILANLSAQLKRYDSANTTGVTVNIPAGGISLLGNMMLSIDVESSFGTPVAGESYKLILSEGTRLMTDATGMVFKVISAIIPLDDTDTPLSGTPPSLTSGAVDTELRVPYDGLAAMTGIKIELLDMDKDMPISLDSAHSGVLDDVYDKAWVKFPYNLPAGQYGIGICRETNDGKKDLLAVSKFNINGVNFMNEFEIGVTKQTYMEFVGGEFPNPVDTITTSDGGITIGSIERVNNTRLAVTVDVGSGVTAGSYDVTVQAGTTYTGILQVKGVTVSNVNNLINGDWYLEMKGNNLHIVDTSMLSGKIYSGATQVANLSNFEFDFYKRSMFAQIVGTAGNNFTNGAYRVELFKDLAGTVPFGGSASYAFNIINPVGVDNLFQGTVRKVVVLPNGNNFGTDKTLLKVDIMSQGQTVLESTSASVYYPLNFSGVNLEFPVPFDFNRPDFNVEVYKKADAGSPFEFVSRGYYGTSFGPTYDVGPSSAMPGQSNISLDLWALNSQLPQL